MLELELKLAGGGGGEGVGAVAGVEAGQWGGPRPVGSVRSKTACACARANFSHIHFCTNFAAKLIANRLIVSTYYSVRFLDKN